MTTPQDDASSLSRVPITRRRHIAFPLAMDSERLDVLWTTFTEGGPSKPHNAWIEADGWKVNVPQDLTRKGTGKSHFDQVRLIHYLDSAIENLTMTIHGSSATLYSSGQPATHTRADKVFTLVEEWKPKRSFTRHLILIAAVCGAILLGLVVSLLVEFFTDLSTPLLLGIQVLVGLALAYPAAVWGGAAMMPAAHRR